MTFAFSIVPQSLHSRKYSTLEILRTEFTINVFVVCHLHFLNIISLAFYTFLLDSEKAERETGNKGPHMWPGGHLACAVTSRPHVQPNDCPLILYTCIPLTFHQAANAGKSLFLLYALKRSPRLTLFYLYIFDYSETFLPFLHTCCPAITHIDQSVESSFLNMQVTL